jgi:hypothetical protein
MRTEKLKVLDTVAILKDLPEKKVVFGQVGTIVEELGNNVFEVEFADRHGKTISEFAVPAADLMLLHFEMEYSSR